MNDFIRGQADSAFIRAVKKGRFTSFNRKHCCIPTLDSLTKIIPPESESYMGIKDISVNKIIGTENRNNDFSYGFYPRKHFLMTRWVKIYELFHTDRMHESIKVIKYGGYFFVRDGNHRVSVAKIAGIEYLTAEIVEYKVSTNLPAYFDMGKIELFKEKYNLNKRTGLFKHLNEDDFDVRCPSTWKMLEKEIFCYNKSWYIRHFKREPDDKELITGWNRSLYINIMSHIRKHSLLYLFPGMGLTDIFIEFIKFWNSFENPDQFWIEEAYDNFTKQIRKRKFYLALIQIFISKMSYFFRPENYDREYLETITQISEFKPDFTIPKPTSAFYRFLYRQIAFSHALHLKKNIGRSPYIQELVSDWYDNYYKPLYDHFFEKEISVGFSRYYIRFSKKYYNKVACCLIPIDDALKEYA